MRLKVEVVRGCEGRSLYINDYRVAGSKPWGGGLVEQEWNITSEDILKANILVRCGQCKHWKTEDDHCTHPAGLCATGKKARNNYCSFGERKDGEG